MESTQAQRRLEGLAEALERTQDGSATLNDLQVISEAATKNPSDVVRARKLAGLAVTRGVHADVEVTVSGISVGTPDARAFYALKALAAETGREVDLRIVPRGARGAEQVNPDVVQDLCSELESGEGRPRDLAARVAA